MADDPILDDGIVFSMTPDFLDRDRLTSSSGRDRRFVSWRDSTGNEPRDTAFADDDLDCGSLGSLSR